MKQKLFTFVTLLVAIVTGAWADDYYTPTSDEVIILSELHSASATTTGYSSHPAVTWDGTGTSMTSSVKAGDPNNGGEATSGNVTCYHIKNNGGKKNIKLHVSGVSKITLYHIKDSEKYPQLILTPSSGDGSTLNGEKNVYYNEFDIDGTKSYTIALHGTTGSDDQDKPQVYAIKLTKYVAKTIDTQGLKSDNAVKVGTTTLTKDASTNGYSVSGSTITLSSDLVAYATPSNVKLVNHIVYSDESSEDKDVAVSFDGTITSNYYIGSATIDETDYTVRVPQETEAITAVSLNNSPISSSDLTTLQSEHALSIAGSSLNGVNLNVTLNSGAAALTRTNSGDDVVYTFSCNSTTHTVTVTGVKKTYTALGDIVYYSKDGVDATGAGGNSLTANGITFTMENSKDIQYGTGTVTIGENVYQSMKLSTGNAINVTFPAYKKATKVKVYGWSANGDGKLYSIKETNDASAKTAGDLSSDIFYAKNTSGDIYPSVYEYDLDNWESMYFSAGGSASQPFVVMDFVLADSRAVLDDFSFSGGNTSVYSAATGNFVAPTLTATYNSSDITSDLTITYASSNTDVATVDEGTGEVTLTGTTGTATITATFAGDADYQGASDSYDITVAVYPLGSQTITYTLDVTSSEDKNKTDINSTNVSTTTNLNTLIGITNNTGGSYTKGSKANLTVKIPTPASYDENNYMSVGFSVADGCTFTPSSVSVKAQPVSTNKTVKLVLTDGTNSIEKTQENLTQGSIATVTMTNEGGTAFTGDVTLKIYCYGATDTYRLGSPITIAGSVTTNPVSITPAYAKTTYVTTKELDFSSVTPLGLKAYVATDASAGKVTLTEATTVPAGTPLMLIGTASTEYSVPVATTAPAAPATNMFKAGDGTTVFDGSTYDYILFSDGLFYQIGSGTVATTKAYLHCTSDPTAGEARSLSIVFEEGETTGVVSVGKSQTTDNREVYNLAGQRVAQPTKGLYIVNGRKVVIK